MTIPLPTLIERQTKGSPLTFLDGDDNWQNILNFCSAVAQAISGSLNPDGTLTPNSVGAKALQAASIGLAALSPSALYQILPIAQDAGTNSNQYVITTNIGGTNLVPTSAVYDPNGNYVLTGLQLNTGYSWIPSVSTQQDISCVVNPQLTLNAAGTFTATQTSITLTGTPGDPVTASVAQAYAVQSYQNGQTFFVYTARASNGATTLNVNGLGAIPIKVGGQDTTTDIAGQGIFIVNYQNGIFVLVGGGGLSAGVGSVGAGGTTVITETGFSGQQVFNSQSYLLSQAIPGQIAHGLGDVPNSLKLQLQCVSADSGYVAGQTVDISEVTLASGADAFLWFFDSVNVYMRQLGAAYVINPSTSASVALTAANWALVFQAVALQSFAQVVFPALNYMIPSPTGAFSYGNTLFTFQYGSNTRLYSISEINLLNNGVTLLQAQNVSSYDYVNGAVFGGTFFGGSSQPQFIFTCEAGTYQMQAVNPNTNVIPPDTTYNNSGSSASVPVTPSTTYTWSPASGDVSLVLNGTTTYLATNGVQIITTSSASNQSIVLNGSANTVCNGILSTTGITWQPTVFSAGNGANYGDGKPVWYAGQSTAWGASPPYVYAVSSDPGSDSVSSLNCWQINATGQTQNTWATANTNPLNLTLAVANSTNGVVGNNTEFLGWYPSGSSTPVTLFQYNPITKRIYLMTNDIGMIHIFKLNTASNDFTAWWNTALRENQMSYVKTKALAGMSGSLGNKSQGHITVEFDQNTGKEIAVVFTAQADQYRGCAVRVPWVE